MIQSPLVTLNEWEAKVPGFFSFLFDFRQSKWNYKSKPKAAPREAKAATEFELLFRKDHLVGGWTNPSEKYACQNRNLPQIEMKIKNIWVATT